MDKKYYCPLELMKIATQHAYSADYLLRYAIEEPGDFEMQDPLLSIISLMYIAFELTLKAYMLHDHRPFKQLKNLSELLEQSRELVFSYQETQLLKNLSKQYAFRKGIDYELWENRQQFVIFCSELLSLYERVQEMMPLELQRDYQAIT